MNTRLLITTLGLAATLGASQAAALPTGTLTFVEPTGTALPTDNIEVWLRLTIDPYSEPLSLDASAPNYGFDMANFYFSTPEEKWTKVTYASTSVSFLCSGTFTNSCQPGAYSFEFTYSPNSFMKDTINVAPGSSLEYQLLTFKPVGGMAAPGTYSFYGSDAVFLFQGEGYKAALDAYGNVIHDANGDVVYQQELDEFGNPLFNTTQQPVYVQMTYFDGTPITDMYGNPVYEQQLDEFGYPMFDENGNPLYVQATDAEGNPLFETVSTPVLKVFQFDMRDYRIASTQCGPNAWDSCPGFSREVMAAAVPEPETYALMLAGLGLVGFAARKRGAAK